MGSAVLDKLDPVSYLPEVPWCPLPCLLGGCAPSGPSPGIGTDKCTGPGATRIAWSENQESGGQVLGQTARFGLALRVHRQWSCILQGMACGPAQARKVTRFHGSNGGLCPSLRGSFLVGMDGRLVPILLEMAAFARLVGNGGTASLSGRGAATVPQAADAGQNGPGQG